MRRSAFGLLFTLSVLALALVLLLGPGATTASANGRDLCISINGIVRVDTQSDGADCASTESDSGRPNIARAYDGGSASAGFVSTDSGNAVSATGVGSYAFSGHGDNNTVTADGDYSVAIVFSGSNNTVTAIDGGGGYVTSGNNNTVTATGKCFVEAFFVDDQTVTCP